MSITCRSRGHRGFAIVSAIFILVVLGALAAFVVSLSTTQSISFASDVQGARALQAARAGIEWGVSRWLNSSTCTGTTAPHITFSDANLAAFTTVVTATPSTSGGVNFCTLVATATPTGASLGALGYVERQLQVLVEGN